MRPVDDATALVRSLGDPPLPGNRLPAAHYLASVVERAAVLATALAASADLLDRAAHHLNVQRLLQDRGVERRPGEDLADQWRERLERLRRVGGVERGLVPVGAEAVAGVVPGVVTMLLARLRVEPDVVAVVAELEQPVHEHGPRHLGPHVRPDDRRGELGVVVRRELVADVVDERGDDHVDVGAVALRPGGGLQRVPQPRHLVAGQAVVEACAARRGCAPAGAPRTRPPGRAAARTPPACRRPCG